MKFTEATQGRIFIIRLEDGEILHESLEKFAMDNAIKRASLIVLGGADRGSKLVVGPEEGRALPVHPMEHILSDVHEIAGVGTIFPGSQGSPVLHLHGACGRMDRTVTGCARRGVKVWHVMEVILFELINDTATRVPESELGFELLQP